MASPLSYLGGLIVRPPEAPRGSENIGAALGDLADTLLRKKQLAQQEEQHKADLALRQQQVDQEALNAREANARAQGYLDIQRKGFARAGEAAQQERQDEALKEMYAAVASGRQEDIDAARSKLERAGIAYYDEGPKKMGPFGQAPNSPIADSEPVPAGPERPWEAGDTGTGGTFRPREISPGAADLAKPMTLKEKRLSSDLDKMGNEVVGKILPTESSKFRPTEVSPGAAGAALRPMSDRGGPMSLPSLEATGSIGGGSSIGQKALGMTDIPPPGTAVPPAETSAEAPRAAGYEGKGFRLVDRNTGKVIFSASPDTVREARRRRVTQSLAPLYSAAGTPEEKRAAAIAIKFGESLADSVPPEKAVQAATERYDFELGRSDRQKLAETAAAAKKARRGGGGAGGAPNYGGTGMSKGEVTVNEHDRQYVEGIVSRIEVRTNVQKLNDAERQLASVADKAGSKNPVQQREAVASEVRALYNGNSSNRELQEVLSAGGLWTKIENAYNYIAGGGVLSEGYMRDLAHASQEARRRLVEYRAKKGEEAAQAVENDPGISHLSPERRKAYADKARQRVGGFSPKPKASPQQRAEALLKRFPK